MSVIPKLSSSLGIKGEKPNVELAQKIAGDGDKKAVEELIEALKKSKKSIQQDAIKVLYEIGALAPALIAPYAHVFVDQLYGKNNRLQWGGMTALHCLAKETPDAIFSKLSDIMKAADSGSVITRDQAVNILIVLARTDTYRNDALTYILEQFESCPTNQLPMYAERAYDIIGAECKEAAANILTARLDEIEKESKRKRVEKVIKKLNQ